jgi:hypothetical protein
LGNEKDDTLTKVNEYGAHRFRCPTA